MHTRHLDLSGVHPAHDVVRHRMLYSCTRMATVGVKGTKFNFCVSVVAYDIVRYVNTAVKSMCSITATPDDIVRHHTTSSDVV